MDEIVKILTETRKQMNEIVTDLITEGTYQDLLSLQNPQKCNAYNIFLEDELMNKFKKIKLKNLNQGVYISHREFKPCSSEDCPEIRKPLFGAKGKLKTKAQICNTISIFYIRILTLISAILTSINPNNNMAIRRLNALFEPIGEGINKGKISICNEDTKLYTDDFLSIEGMKELVNLYRVYNIEGEERNNIRMRQEINLLQDKIKEYFKGKSSPENTNTNNKIINKLIKKKIKSLRNDNNNINNNSNNSNNSNNNGKNPKKTVIIII